ncbi:ABC transporter ATP-binding protein [Streptomyces solicathayae]|uniref:ABC transporter ATP-binding protein n=1 Tax=Streptomyces solicathayae TaxID=3081768 RepID=A0ABZ0LQN5_9ACTN|nr:ABC transporter ATP-binding protein [Streptomyces sp. HUAS YS2]WOX21667.1 ABC transporter ATP-binding protein [Streptomyces sp. HUAS YS2]
MLQAIGLTSTPRRTRPPAVRDLSFEALPGQVTALLGAAGAGKTTALRLMLGLEPGRGVTYFRGRPLHRVAHPGLEVGVLLGDVPGHPSRTVRGQLRMLCAAVGVRASRADEMLEAVGLTGVHDLRLGTLPLGMDRRLGLACALLGDPHTLLLDQPGAGLSVRENGWLYELVHAHAADGGTVLFTTDDPKEAVRNADRVVTLDAGRLVADQGATEFGRTRLRPRVAVRTPHAARLAAALTQEARADRRSVEVVAEGGNRLSVYGSDCAAIGDTAFRHGVLVHRLADEVGDTGVPSAAIAESPASDSASAAEDEPAAAPDPPHGPAIERRPARAPRRPFRYEIRRLLGVPSTGMVAAATLIFSVVVAVVLARGGRTPLPVVVAGWPELSPLPPAAIGAGLLGALSFGDEYRHPALTSGRGVVPRRLGLLIAKLTVTGAVAVLLAVLAVVADIEVLHLLYGGDLIPVPDNWPSLCASWIGLAVGCAWAGLLGAGVFRATAAGVAAVLAVPVAVVPALRATVASGRSVAGLPARLRELMPMRWPSAGDRWLDSVFQVVGQPVGVALVLSLTTLLCAYLLTGLRRRARW